MTSSTFFTVLVRVGKMELHFPLLRAFFYIYLDGCLLEVCIFEDYVWSKTLSETVNIVFAH